MNLDKYALVSDTNHLAYEFLSEGLKGTIKKVVFYQRIDENIFNLSFGDWDETTQQINDAARSNNNDRDKVLATVASTIIDFMKYHSSATIFAKGSTPSRTRLYQIGILANWHEILQIYDVEGFVGNEWQPIQKQKNYSAFLLKAKEKL